MATRKVLDVVKVTDDDLLVTLQEVQSIIRFYQSLEKELKLSAMGKISMFNENIIQVNDTLQLNASITPTMVFNSKQFREENEELYNQYKNKEQLKQNFIIKEVKEDK